MKCKDCKACCKGYFKSEPNKFVCIGVREHFIINDINRECTEYKELLDIKMDKVANSGNDEFYTPLYAVKPIAKYIPRFSKIWCPFDTDDSLFVKYFRELGYEVIATHIQNGVDFFKTEVPDCDYIISNPPYSVKGKVFERLFEIGKPFAMLVGVVGLFESQGALICLKTTNLRLCISINVSHTLRITVSKSPRLIRRSAVFICAVICCLNR